MNAVTATSLVVNRSSRIRLVRVGEGAIESSGECREKYVAVKFCHGGPPPRGICAVTAERLIRRFNYG
jgi:hypothetical protein